MLNKSESGLVVNETCFSYTALSSCTCLNTLEKTINIRQPINTLIAPITFSSFTIGSQCNIAIHQCLIRTLCVIPLVNCFISLLLQVGTFRTMLYNWAFPFALRHVLIPNPVVLFKQGLTPLPRQVLEHFLTKLKRFLSIEKRTVLFKFKGRKKHSYRLLLC